MIDLGPNRNTDNNAKSKKMAKHWPSKIRRRIGCRKKGIFAKNSGNEFITGFSFMLVQSHAILEGLWGVADEQTIIALSGALG